MCSCVNIKIKGIFALLIFRNRLLRLEAQYRSDVIAGNGDVFTAPKPELQFGLPIHCLASEHPKTCAGRERPDQNVRRPLQSEFQEKILVWLNYEGGVSRCACEGDQGTTAWHARNRKEAEHQQMLQLHPSLPIGPGFRLPSRVLACTARGSHAQPASVRSTEAMLTQSRRIRQQHCPRQFSVPPHPQTGLALRLDARRLPRSASLGRPGPCSGANAASPGAGTWAAPRRYMVSRPPVDERPGAAARSRWPRPSEAIAVRFSSASSPPSARTSTVSRWWPGPSPTRTVFAPRARKALAAAPTSRGFVLTSAPGMYSTRFGFSSTVLPGRFRSNKRRPSISARSSGPE